MELLLREDVPDLGQVGDVVNVADGYARNYLLPRRLAVRVTAENKRQIETAQKKRERAEAERRAQIQQTVEALEDVSVTISAQANEEGRLFGSVGPTEIAEALADEGFKVPERAILLEKPLKEIGVYQVAVQPTAPPDGRDEGTVQIKVWVIQE